MRIEEEDASKKENDLFGSLSLLAFSCTPQAMTHLVLRRGGGGEQAVIVFPLILNSKGGQATAPIGYNDIQISFVFPHMNAYTHT